MSPLVMETRSRHTGRSGQRMSMSGCHLLLANVEIPATLGIRIFAEVAASTLQRML
ncbi:hypothetical protein NEOLEDRAFT_1143594 [Neolentinus lepideus HHB14362 ss-1]|uniref:Uncharacterized protein n=1 Tax=Neolentinus lepideus HHB14362 ss-1 TaxID=1314782 RepID=A0A165MFX4_9AGAM|nr:hypothetical protein NEOLEDRAFT_1143594 [Neolentinus lepideus HHB14362 ss-1]